MSSQPPKVDTVVDMYGSTVTSVQDDGRHVIITASPGCPPWLVTIAARQAKQALMPSAQAAQDAR